MADKVVHNEDHKVTVDKIRYELVDPEFDEGVACALTNGISKYAPYSWRKVDPPLYVGAFKRHMKEHTMAMAKAMESDLPSAIEKYVDPDSGLLHIDHAIACLMFLRWNAMQIPAVREVVTANINNRTFTKRRPE